MLETYISKLIDNIPLSKKKQREKIDLILDGGLFNGSYLIGAIVTGKQIGRAHV